MLHSMTVTTNIKTKDSESTEVNFQCGRQKTLNYKHMQLKNKHKLGPGQSLKKTETTHLSYTMSDKLYSKTISLSRPETAQSAVAQAFHSHFLIT